MSIHERIMAAIDSANYLHKQGMHIDDAVAKSINGLSAEGISRVIEGLNVGQFCGMLKSGGDRTAPFPIASPKQVMKKMANQVLATTDLLPPAADFDSLDFYTREEKVAMAKDAEFVLSGNHDSDDTRLNNFLKCAALEQKEQEIIDEAANHLLDETRQAIDLLQAKSATYHVEVLQVADMLYSELGKQALPVIGVMQKAAGISRRPRSVHFIDDSLPLYKLAKDVADGLGVLRKIAGEYPTNKKELNELWTTATTNAETKAEEKYKQRFAEAKDVMFMGGWDAATKKIQENLDKDAKDNVKDNKKGAGKDSGFKLPTLSAVMSPVSSFAGKALSSIPQQLAKPTGGSKKRGPDSTEVTALGLKYKSVFEDLINNDEILAEKDPGALASFYRTMINISPHVAGEKEIVRAYLRQISTQASMSPQDAKQLAQLEGYMSGDTDKVKD